MITNEDLGKLKTIFVTKEEFHTTLNQALNKTENELVLFIKSTAQATKEEMRDEFVTGLKSLKHELRQEMIKMKQELRTEMKDMKNELKNEIIQIKDMMYVFIDEI